MELLEREPYLNDLARLLTGAAGGRGQLAFVAGEAGVGKTVLVGEFCRSGGQAVRVLRGTCDPLSTPQPLGPLIDIARAVGGDLERLLRETGQRHQVFSAFLDLLAPGPIPALVVFEDVHWADEATLDLLRFTGRRIDTVPALVIATYRDDEVGVGHPLRVVLGDLATSASVHRVALPRLTEAAVRRLAEDSLIDPADLYRQTGGNPFFVTETLAAGQAGIPLTVRDAVLARAARLSAAARSVLDAAAAIGPTIEVALLEEVAGAEAIAIEECVELGVLRYQGAELVFRHEIARETILDALPPQRRVALFQTILNVLEASNPGPDMLARLAHYAEAAGDRERVHKYAPEAARRAVELSAHREAAAQYARVLRFDGELIPTERAAFLEAYSNECVAIDRMDDAIDSLQKAAAIWHSTNQPLREGQNLSELSRGFVLAGRNAEAERTSRAGLDLLQKLPPSSELARAYLMQANLRMLNRDHAEAIDWGNRAIALAERLGETLTICAGYTTIGSAMLVSGDDDGITFLERGLTLSRAAGLDSGVAGAYGNLGSGTGEMYRFSLAERYLSEGIAFCAERDLDYQRFYMTSWLALCHLYQGRWSAAADVAASVTQRPAVATDRKSVV